MKHVLIAGIDTIVGGNLALALSQQHRVTGLSSSRQVQIAGCHIEPMGQETTEDIRRRLAATSPDLVVVCGPAAVPTWAENSEGMTSRNLQAAVRWASEVAQTGARLMVVSSDAVFHGPWMFHDEQCTGVCQSKQATAIREMESQVLSACPSALILRTQVFGWDPNPQGGWLESLLDQLADESPLTVPAINYATPIEASRFAEISMRACDRGLEGIYHLGGSERVNFMHFAHRLAQEFQLPRPRFQSRLQPEPHTFGQGETSLTSARIRRRLATPLPMLSESLQSLRQLAESGERDRLQAKPQELAASAA